jgi:hypothetical protein
MYYNVKMIGHQAPAKDITYGLKMFFQLPDKKPIVLSAEENLLPVVSTVVDVVDFVWLIKHSF